MWPDSCDSRNFCDTPLLIHVCHPRRRWGHAERSGCAVRRRPRGRRSVSGSALTRTRRASLRTGQLPLETLETALRIAGRAKADISAYAIAEPGIELPPDLRVERLDHHYAHAATAFYTSPFDEAIVLVCDRHGIPDLTIWRGDQSGIRREDFSWIGPGFATVYSQLAEAFGFAPEGDEHRVEALAHGARRCSPCHPAVDWIPRRPSGGVAGVPRRPSPASSPSNGHEGWWHTPRASRTGSSDVSGIFFWN